MPTKYVAGTFFGAAADKLIFEKYHRARPPGSRRQESRAGIPHPKYAALKRPAFSGPLGYYKTKLKLDMEVGGGVLRG